MQKRIMISATRETDGKTAVTVGLTLALKKHFPKIGFIKPLGMRDVVSGPVELDDDVILIEKACGVHCNIQDMNPVLMDRSELVEFWKEGKQEGLIEEIKSSFESVAEDKDLVVMEGPGHAGSGSAFGISTAFIAKELGAKVILVTSGGITHPIDEITLNLSHFMKYGVEVIGVILNKVDPGEMAKVQSLFSDMLARRNVELLGVLPFEESFARPTMMQVLEQIGGKVLHGEQYLGRQIGKIFIGAMRPWRVMNLFTENGLLITSGDREDLILSILALRFLGRDGGKRVAGIILTGGTMPHENVMAIIKRTDIPVISLTDFSYEVARKVHKVVPKMTPLDKDKIARIAELTQKHVNIKRIVEKL
jgi:BioD-like phosphotransacetylase family protein